jgi:hypothetical protein
VPPRQALFTHRPDAVAEAVAAALSALGALERQARDTARQFRTAPGARAQRDLTYLIESTQTLLKLAEATAEEVGANLLAVCRANNDSASRTADTVVALMRQQLAHDWDALAETLDGPFIGAMAAWRSVFAAFDTPPDPDPMGYAA